MTTRMSQRRGTAVEWAGTNPLLNAGEIGFEIDTNKFKIGNGQDLWNSLSYFSDYVTIQEYVDSQIQNVEVDLSAVAGTGIDWNSSTSQLDIDSTVATKTYSDNAVSTHNLATTNIHGIANTADLATKSYADQKASDAQSASASALLSHESDTTNIHGIADTSQLATKSYADNAAATAAAAIVDSAPTTLNTLNELAAAINNDSSYAATITTALGNKQDKISGVSDIEIGYLDGVTSGIQAQIDAKLNSSTASSTYAPIDSPTFTGTVSGITKSMVGLGSVENTALSTWTGSSNITTLGTVATGTWSGTTIALNKGGTGATTQADAANAILPSQTGNNGNYLTTNGTNVFWAGIDIPTAATPSVMGTVYGKTSLDGLFTAYGVEALLNNTTGSPNSAFGYWALRSNTTGTSNDAFGDSTLYSVTTGSNNTAFGTQALYSVISGTNNSSFGAGSLLNATGNNNTAIGFSAGVALTTGSNNTIIGYNAAASSGTVSNTITLGNSSITTLRCQVTSITGLSDQRDKKNIEPLTVGLNFVNSLNPVIFDWNMRDGGKVDIPDAGFIAQELMAVEDESGLADHLMLTFRDNPDKLEASVGRLIPILVKAIQDLSAKVATLEQNQK